MTGQCQWVLIVLLIGYKLVVRNQKGKVNKRTLTHNIRHHKNYRPPKQNYMCLMGITFHGYTVL